MRKGAARLDVEVGSRVTVVASEPFAVVGCRASGDGELLPVAMYGPIDSSVRRVEFRAEHAVLEVRCSSKCEWQEHVRVHDWDPSDGLPVEVPVRLQRPRSIRDEVLAELDAREKARRAAEARDTFSEDLSDEDEEPTEYEVLEMLVQEAVLEGDADGARGTEIGAEGATEVEADERSSELGSSDGDLERERRDDSGDPPGSKERPGRSERGARPGAKRAGRSNVKAR